MSTTLSTACTAASNYACSTPFMTITASSRSSCLMARGVSSPRCCARASGPAATRSAPSCAASSAPSAPSGRGSRSCCAPILTTPARRSSTGAERTGSIGCWGWLPMRRHVEALEKTTAERFTVAPARGKVRRFAQFHDAAGSWSRVERIIARVEAGAEGTDTRFIVTNLEGGRAKPLYQRLFCARGQAENHIKAWKNHLAADRTSCHEATANQFRLFLHAGSYWLLWSMRRLMPKGSAWRVMQFDTLRLRLIKIAARVVELKKQIKIHLPSRTPDQAIFGIILNRLPRLVT